jgi:hypothetical protein
MRLSKKQLDAIHKSFVAHFLPLDTLWLFGSRVDDLKKGGGHRFLYRDPLQ